MPSRILDKNVGGNTTYAREIATRLPKHGIHIDRLRSGKNPVATMLNESLDSRRSSPESVVHFVADTGPLLSPRMPSVVTVHGVASRWISTARNPLQEYIWRARVGAAIRNCDHVITVSESSADDVSTIFKLDRASISVIPHGISQSNFQGIDEFSDSVAGQVPDQFLLYVGNIEPRKNLIELVNAVENNHDLPQLVVAGKPAWNFSESMDVIAKSTRTIYLGFVSDADRAALMSRCVAFVFPSLYEGFGFPVLEAMAAGAPVITTDRGSLKEVAGPAWILQGTGSKAIGEGIEAALADAAWQKDIREQGRSWASKFSWDESVRKHVAIYRSLLT
ncbi:glycosyl transferase family 1 [Paenarthrobacter nitroguajacolicus]|uniref:glycosyltransferase family 4 protein n=1 Tax=Paenarthrobacter nitroguajacolicus TaxID=211146 RepID=UPI0015C03929|nr:glycosyltransferase family 1 protein [Paenarthrobacter nitroguajacolicus]NWL13837.1 glycosyl transferase family 1 [Paenarthrobacter nitroguajacolicus]